MLSDLHRQTLETGSGISPEVIADRCYWTATTKAELARLGFPASQQLVPALVIPIFDVHGEIATYQIRPDTPRLNSKGKVSKYEMKAGSAMVLDVPSAVRSHLGDPSKPLWITEGSKKADAAVSQGALCIALLGVWNFRGTNDRGGKVILPAFEHVALNGRRAYIAFDSDLPDKDPVRLALLRFALWLTSRGADVRIVRIPAGEHGAKQGLDDFLVTGKTLDTLIATSQGLDKFEVERPGGPYRFERGGIWYSPNAETDRPLTNFTAKITTDVVMDDGVDTVRAFEIEADHRGKPFSFSLSADEFSGMNWPVKYLGAAAITYPGQSTKEHTRVGIQTLSGDVATRREFTHTGWATIDDELVFLSKSGAIGANGINPDVVVNLGGSLSRYSLPAPPTGDELKHAVQASMRMLDVAPMHITTPLFALTYRAPLGQIDASLHIAAQTGSGKSEVSALVMQHYGKEMDARHLPASWMSTANANEALGFLAKDAVLCIDDFAPVGSQADVARMHKDADRLLRGVGNNAGRMRMRADTSLRDVRPVRAMVLSSGEDTPRGESLNARMFTVEMDQRSMRWGHLSRCQQDASAGLYAAAMSGYLQWLAKHAASVFDRFRTIRADLREHAASIEGHKRTPAIVADLAAGYHIFSEFAVDVGAMTQAEADERWPDVWQALNDTAAQQASHQAQNEPTRLFREYLSAAVSAGKAHLATVEGSAPLNAQAYGWQLVTAGEKDRWQPRGDRIGWTTHEGMFLEPKAAYSVAQSIAQRSGESLGVTPARLNKSLKEKGFLLSVDSNRGVLTIRKRIGDRSINALHVSLQFLDSGGVSIPPDKPDKPDIEPKKVSNGAATQDAFLGFIPDNGMAKIAKTDIYAAEGVYCDCGHVNPVTALRCAKCDDSIEIQEVA